MKCEYPAAQLREVFEERGGEPVWSIKGDFGRLESWQFADGNLILHSVSKGWVKVYGELSAEAIEDIVHDRGRAENVPDSPSQGDAAH